MNLINLTRELKFTQAFDFAQRVLQDQLFWNAIKAKESFDSAAVSLAEIASLLHDINRPISIVSWTPSRLQPVGKYKRTNAVTGSKDLIRLNTRKINRVLRPMNRPFF